MADDSNAATTPTAPKKKSRLKKLLKVGFGLFVFLVVGLAVFPAIASATFLTGTVQGQLQKQFGAGTTLGKVSFGWTSGLAIDDLKIPSAGPNAKVKDRNAVELKGVRATLSVPALAKAALTGGEAETKIEVDQAKVYLELHPDGKTNLDMPPAAPATSSPDSRSAPPSDTQSAPAEPKPLPCSARSTIDVKSVDVEVADMTSSTGVVQRTVMKGLHVGLLAHVDKDTSAQLDTLDPKDKTLAFEKLEITQEEPNKPAKLVIGVERPEIVARLKYAGKLPESAKQAAIKALASLHQLDAVPTIDVKRVYSDDFDLNGLGVHVTVGPKDGHQLATLEVSGVLKGQHEGAIKLTASADLGAGKGKLPASYELHLNSVDITGVVAKKMPLILPVLAGTQNYAQGQNHLPTLTFSTKGSIETRFDAKEAFDRSPTLRSIVDSGEVLLGPGSFEGSKIIQGFASAFEKLELKDVLDKATGGDPFRFDGVTEAFNVKDGVVTISKLELARQGYGVAISGTVAFEGHYKLAAHFDDKMYAKLAPDVAKLLQAVDKAGGIGIEGDLAGGCTVATPPAEVLAKAMLEGGALDLLRARNPKAAARLDGLLGKTGTSVDKIVNDPKKAAQDAAKTQATQQADKALDKNKDKIEKATGVSEDKLKGAVNGLLGGGDKKDDAKPDDKKDEKPIFKNPFGGD